MVTCADYVGVRGDIPDFEAIVAANQAGARSRAGGFDNAVAMANPPGAAFLSRLDGMITTLGGQLRDGQTAELTVAIAAHGGAGYVIMQDRAHVTYDELVARANRARAQRVRVVFVIDACLSGELVQRANEAATLDGLMAAAGNRPGQRQAQRLLDIVTRLNPPLGVVNREGGQVRLRGRRVSHQNNPANYRSLVQALTAMNDGLDDIVTILRGASLPASEASSLPGLLDAVRTARARSLLGYSGDWTGVRQTVRSAGAAVDACNGLVRRLIEQARRLSTQAQPARQPAQR